MTAHDPSLVADLIRAGVNPDIAARADNELKRHEALGWVRLPLEIRDGRWSIPLAWRGWGEKPVRPGDRGAWLIRLARRLWGLIA